MATVVYDCFDFCYSAKNNGIDEEEARKMSVILIPMICII